MQRRNIRLFISSSPVKRLLKLRFSLSLSRGVSSYSPIWRGWLVKQPAVSSILPHLPIIMDTPRHIISRSHWAAQGSRDYYFIGREKGVPRQTLNLKWRATKGYVYGMYMNFILVSSLRPSRLQKMALYMDQLARPPFPRDLDPPFSDPLSHSLNFFNEYAASDSLRKAPLCGSSF